MVPTLSWQVSPKACGWPEETFFDVRSLWVNYSANQKQSLSTTWAFYRASSRVANARLWLCPQTPEFLLLLALATHLTPASFYSALSLRISSLALPGFGWGGKGNNVRDSVCSPFHTLRCQEGLEVARGAHSHAISCRRLLSCAAISGKEKAQGGGSGGAESRFWNSSTSRASLILWNCTKSIWLQSKILQTKSFRQISWWVAYTHNAN